MTAATFAQSDRGTLTGTVTDSANAVVPGAKVTARNSEMGALFETATTPTGNYTITSLPVGLYDLTVEAAGFSKKTQQGIRVQVAQTVRLDVALQVGSATESVTVAADAPLLKTGNAEISMNVSGDKFNQLPLNFGAGGTGSIRNWLAFATLAPGVNGDLSTNQGTSVNGLPGGLMKIVVEGTDVTSSNDSRWTSIVAASSVEAIAEFSLQTANFSAQYGGGLGVMFNFTMPEEPLNFFPSSTEELGRMARFLLPLLWLALPALAQRLEVFDTSGMPRRPGTFVEQQILDLIGSHRAGDLSGAARIHRKLGTYYVDKKDQIRAREAFLAAAEADALAAGAASEAPVAALPAPAEGESSLTGNYFGFQGRTVHTWEFHRDRTFLHTWMVPGSGTSVRNSERGWFRLLDDAVELKLTSTAGGFASPAVGGRGTAVGGGAERASQVRQIALRRGSNGEIALLEGVAVKVKK